MSVLTDILQKCNWKISQENKGRHFERCYNCNGYKERAKEINCPYWTIAKSPKYERLHKVD